MKNNVISNMKLKFEDQCREKAEEGDSDSDATVWLPAALEEEQKLYGNSLMRVFLCNGENVCA